jgi:hypothetical protein
MKPAERAQAEFKSLWGLLYLAGIVLFTAGLTSLIVFPLWFFSVKGPFVFNVVILCAAGAVFLALALSRLVRRKLVLPSVIFIVLCGHITGIWTLLSQKQYLLAVILAFDFVLTMELSRPMNWLRPVLRKILIGAAFSGFLYHDILLFKEQEWIYAVLFALVMLSSLVSGIYGRKKATPS